MLSDRDSYVQMKFWFHRKRCVILQNIEFKVPNPGDSWNSSKAKVTLSGENGGHKSKRLRQESLTPIFNCLNCLPFQLPYLIVGTFYLFNSHIKLSEFMTFSIFSCSGMPYEVLILWQIWKALSCDIIIQLISFDKQEI